MMDALTEAIYKEIQTVARGKSTIHYGVLAKKVNLRTGRDRRLHRALDEINRWEHAHQGPLLSAVVVLAGEGIPGKGFFPLAQSLNRFDPNKQARRAYWRQERQDVYRHWSS